MARIDKAKVLEATRVTRRAVRVAEDPAVVKAAKQAGRDVTQAVRSCCELTAEVRAAWARSA